MEKRRISSSLGPQCSSNKFTHAAIYDKVYVGKRILIDVILERQETSVAINRPDSSHLERVLVRYAIRRSYIDKYRARICD